MSAPRLAAHAPDDRQPDPRGVAQAARLLRWYPRAWRDRYADEFLAMFDDAPLSVRQSMDVLIGAVDARLASRRRPDRHSKEEPAMTTNDSTLTVLKHACRAPRRRTTWREGVVGALLMLGATLVLSAAAVDLHHLGYHEAGTALKALSFPLALLVWSDYAYLRGHRLVVRAAITGVPALLLIGSALASMIW